VPDERCVLLSLIESPESRRDSTPFNQDGVVGCQLSLVETVVPSHQPMLKFTQLNLKARAFALLVPL